MNIRECFRVAVLSAFVFCDTVFGATNGAFRAGVVLVAFRDAITTAEQTAILKAIGAVDLKHIGAGTHVVSVNKGYELAAIELLKKFGAIRYAEPDYRHTLTAGSLPNDTSLGFQWAVQNTGQNIGGINGTPGADEKSPLAWGITTGTNSVVVAVVDTGLQYSHPDLITNVWNNPGGINGCAAGTHGYNVLTQTCDPMDDDTEYDGHGTHVAGILGAVGNNAMGVTGVNWTTSIMSIKWIDAYATGYTSDLITSLDWIISAKQAGVNVRVVNDSAVWDGTAASQALSDEIDLLGSNDILFVSAADNSGVNNDLSPRYPCNYDRPNQLCVAATDQKDNLWTSSDYGTNSVQLAAPGVNIFSTMRQSNYGYVSGCSMSVPQVAGTAALILSMGYQPVATLRSMILNGVDQLPGLAAFVSSGGRLNVCKAIPGCTTATTGTPLNQSLPVVTGVPQFGSIAGASTGIWSGLPTTYTYQWYRCNSGGANCTLIQGATGQSYPALAAADAGATLRVLVTGTNSRGAASAESAASATVGAALSPFTMGSSILDGGNITGIVQWQASPAQTVNFVQFYIDGMLSQTVSAPPYVFSIDTSTLATGPHTFGLRALAADNRTYGFYGANVTVTPPSQYTPRLVQSTAQEGSGLPSISAAFQQPNTAGNLVVAFVRMSTTSETVSVKDSAGNAYVDAVSQGQTADGHQVHIFYAKNAIGGANTVTATFSATNNHPWLAIYEYSGVNKTAPLDQTAAAQGIGIAVNSGATATTASANELIFAATGFANDYTGVVSAGGGYVLQQQDLGASRAANETSIASSSGSFSSVFSLSSSTDWTAVVATFLPATATINPPSITTTSVPAGTQYVSYSTQLSAASGVTPYAWSISSGALPAGLGLNSTSGVISGIPTAAGTSNFTVTVTDRNLLTASKAFVMAINPAVSGAIALAQSSAVEGAGLTSISNSFPAPNNAGNMIVAFVRMSTANQTLTVTDSNGNVYQDAVNQAQTTDGHQVHIFYAKNIKGGANMVTATFSALNNHPWLAIYEYSGLNKTSPLDRTASAQGINASPTTGPTLPTTSANELVFAALGLPNNDNGVVTFAPGFTPQQQDLGLSRAANETEVATARGSFKGAFTLNSSSQWTAVIATFKP